MFKGLSFLDCLLLELVHSINLLNGIPYHNGGLGHTRFIVL